MSYGISIKKANGQQLADPTMLGGRLFVQRIFQAVGTSATYTFTGVPSENDLIIYTATAGFHTITTGTSGGSATLTLTAISRNPSAFPVPTQLLIFTKKTKEPDYGCLVVNDSGEKLVSTVYPCPRYLISGTPINTGTVSFSSEYPYQHEYQIDLGSDAIDSTRLVLWQLPDDTSNDIWYNGDSCIPPGYQNILTMKIMSKSSTPPSCPVGHIFQMDNISASNQNYGIRILNTDQKVTFDSGLNHLVIKDLTEGLYFDVPPLDYDEVLPPVTITSFNIAAYSTISNPLCYLPIYYQEASYPAPGGLIQSRQFSLSGYSKREGSTMKLAVIGTWNIEDASVSFYYVFGGYNQITLTANLADYV